MRSLRVSSIKEYLRPMFTGWNSIKADQVPLMATPLAMQPTGYIRNSWEGKPYGSTPMLAVTSVHDGHAWAIRVSWKGVSAIATVPGSTDFPDALAVALPVSGNPALVMMGAPDAPIHILRWAANKSGVRSVLATGIGQSAPGPELSCNATAVAVDDIRSVVISRVLGTGPHIAPLLAGHQTGVGFALWCGANQERAGIKAFSIDWAKLTLDA